VTRLASASRVSAPPVRVGNSGSLALPPRSFSHTVIVLTVVSVSGVTRFAASLPERRDVRARAELHVSDLHAEEL